MSIAAAALALSREFQFDESTHYTLRPLNYEDLAQFSVWCEERARAGMFRASDGDGVDGKQLLQAFLDNVAAGTYEPGGDAFGRATRSDAGGRKILELMLIPPDGEKQPDKWRQDTAWDIFADPEAFQRAMVVAGELNKNPKAVAARRRPTPTQPETPSR